MLRNDEVSLIKAGTKRGSHGGLAGAGVQTPISHSFTCKQVSDPYRVSLESVRPGNRSILGMLGSGTDEKIEANY